MRFDLSTVRVCVICENRGSRFCFSRARGQNAIAKREKNLLRATDFERNLARSRFPSGNNTYDEHRPNFPNCFYVSSKFLHHV